MEWHESMLEALTRCWREWQAALTRHWEEDAAFLAGHLPDHDLPDSFPFVELDASKLAPMYSLSQKRRTKPQTGTASPPGEHREGTDDRRTVEQRDAPLPDRLGRTESRAGA